MLVDILKCNLKTAEKRQNELTVRKTAFFLWGRGAVRM